MKTGNGYSTEQNLVIGVSKVLPGPNLVHAFSSIIFGENAVEEKQEGAYNRVISPVITIGTSFLGVSGFLNGTAGTVNTVVGDGINNIPAAVETGKEIYKNNQDAKANAKTE